MSLDDVRHWHVGRWLYGVVAGLTITAGVIGLYLWTWQPDQRLYPQRGIDVSHHQGRIDWRAVARDGISFAYLKASEGGDYVDPTFSANLVSARQAGLRVGAYHFFTFCRSGGDQARHFLATLGTGQTNGRPAADLPALDLPAVVDLEFGGNCGARPSPASLQVELAGFLSMVEHTLGQKMVLYTTDEFDAAYGAILPPRPRWRRSLFQMPAEPGWLIWQYHNAGHVAGIDGRVDLDVINLESYCADTPGRPVSDIADFACSAGRDWRRRPSDQTGSRPGPN